MFFFALQFFLFCDVMSKGKILQIMENHVLMSKFSQRSEHGILIWFQVRKKRYCCLALSKILLLNTVGIAKKIVGTNHGF